MRAVRPPSRRRVLRGLSVLLGAALACWGCWRIYRAVCVGRLCRELSAKGFPASYARALADLKFDRPNWIFELQPVTDLAWSEILRREETPSWNLVIASDWAPEKWKALGSRNYTPYYAADAKAYDSGAWRQASRAAIAYFLDPRNFLNERDVFMFETLGHDAASQTHEAVSRILSQTFMHKACPDGGTQTFAELLMDVGRKTGVSPVFLAGRLASEQGAGSVQAFGTIGDALARYATNETGKVGNAVIWGQRFTRDSASTQKALARGKDAYNGYYNFFNFRAYGLGLFEIKYNAWIEATADETRLKYLGPWNTQARAIEGGAMKIRERYIDTHRHTRYLQKFSVLREAGAFRWKQYMQNIAAPLVEARHAFRAYQTARTLGAPCRFLIPVYRGMPKRPCPDPAAGRSVYSPSRP